MYIQSSLVPRLQACVRDYIHSRYVTSSTDSAIVLIFIADTIALAKHRDNTLYLGKNSGQFVGPAELK